MIHFRDEKMDVQTKIGFHIDYFPSPAVDVQEILLELVEILIFLDTHLLIFLVD